LDSSESDNDKAEPAKMVEDSSESDADGDVKMSDAVPAVNGCEYHSSFHIFVAKL
jgi:hypothetical protein